MAELRRDSFHGLDPDGVGASFHEDPGGTHVEFYYHKVAQKDFCRMVFPGNRLTVWDQPVREKDKLRFPQQWRLYKEGKDQLHGQTMLQSWGDIDPGSVEIYQGLHILTVEQLANVPDANMGNMPPGHMPLAYRHREMAREYVQQQKQSAGFDQALEAAQQSQDVARAAVKENAELRAQIEELQRRMDAQRLTDPAAVYPKVAKKKPGGWIYELSNGELVTGKKAAEDAQRVLDAA